MSVAGWSSFVIVQVADSPLVRSVDVLSSCRSVGRVPRGLPGSVTLYAAGVDGQVVLTVGLERGCD